MTTVRATHRPDDGCSECPLREEKPIPGLGHEYSVCQAAEDRPLTHGEVNHGAPEWCPLRGGPVTVIVEVPPCAVVAPRAPLFASLHHAFPFDAQDRSETGYGGYARVRVDLDADGHAAAFVFPECTREDPRPVTHYAIGTAASGPGEAVRSGPLTSGPIVLVAGTSVRFAAGAIDPLTAAEMDATAPRVVEMAGHASRRH